MEMVAAFPVHSETGILNASSSSDRADICKGYLRTAEQAIIILNMHHRHFVKWLEKRLPEQLAVWNSWAPVLYTLTKKDV